MLNMLLLRFALVSLCYTESSIELLCNGVAFSCSGVAVIDKISLHKSFKNY